MQVKMIVFPREEGFSVLIWEKWTEGSMRVRRFDNRSEMIAALSGLGLISSADAEELDSYVFTDSCPLYSSEIDDSTLAEHGFCHV